MSRRGGAFFHTTLKRLVPDTLPKFFFVAFSFLVLFFAIFAFRNIAPLQIVALWLMYVAPVLLLALVQSSHSPKTALDRRLSAFDATSGTIAALVFFVFLAMGHSRRWSDYFGNFGDERFELGGGYSIDSVFHISLIEGILDSGLPSTGLHGQPQLWYHTGTHYFDAFAALVTQVAPWESYSLLFVLKNAALLISIVLFIMTVAVRASPVYALLLSLFVYVPTYHLGYLAGSHSNWLPAVLIAIFFPRIWRTLKSPNPLRWRSLGEFSALIMAVTLGKISMGFALAIFIGLALLFTVVRRRFDGWAQLVSISILWILWFALSSRAFEFGEESLGFLDRLDRVWPHIWFFVFAIFVHIFVGLIAKNGDHLVAAGIIGATLLVLIIVVGVVVTTKRADVFLFFLASTMISLFFSVSTFLSDNFPKTEEDMAKSVPASLPAVSGALILVLIAGAPLATESPQLQNLNLRTMAKHFQAANSWTYEWYNEGHPDAKMTVWRAVAGGKVLRQDTFLGQARNRLEMSQHKSPGNQVHVFISRQGFEFLLENYGRAELRDDQSADIALLIRAAVGAPLVFGSNKMMFTDERFGFSEYSDELGWLDESQVTEADLCVFGGPVLYLKPNDLEASEDLCIS